ncbi:MAG: beta-N-acetylhexosaminidase [Ferruginibacter sp.]
MNKIILLLTLITYLPVTAQNNINIIPMPAKMVVPETPGTFTITKNTTIVLADSSMEKSAAFLNEYLQFLFGFQLKTVRNVPGKKSIALNYSLVLNYRQTKNDIPGAYTLEIGKNGINITGDDETGTFYGIQTLIQLLPVEKKTALPVPYISIIDKPRFAYRGMHLDVGRHFMPPSFIKDYIDYLALHKFNNFHWHLTEDQGWRIEIKKYPLLTQVGGCREQTLVGRYGSKTYDGKKYCGFYTQEEIKEIVKYAADRYINIIPEIELPGHALAAITAYPELSCTPAAPKKVAETWGVFEDVFCPTENTFTFLENVLDEVMALFPSGYIHIGGDECPKEAWKRSDFCQQLIKEKGLKDEHGLQSYFIQRIEKYINSKGRKIIGWDEILEGGLAPNAAVMSWRGEEGGIVAAQQNHDVIMTPGSHCYLDHSQSKKEDSVTIGGYLPLETVYSYEPIPAKLSPSEAKYILGAQGNVWTEYMNNTSKVEYMIFPRLSAMSEVLWSPKEKRNWKDFEKRIPALMKRYDFWGTNYSKAYFEQQTK